MLSTINNEIVDLRGKLHEEMCKIEGLEVEQSYDASNTLAAETWFILRVLYHARSRQERMCHSNASLWDVIRYQLQC